MTGKREDHMDLASREQFLAACGGPTVAGSGLTLWAIPIAAAVVGDGDPMPTVGALVEVTSERSGTTACNGQQHFVTCFQRIHWRLRSTKPSPAARTRSAISRTGRLIYSSSSRQLVEMGHWVLAVTHTYTSIKRQPLIRSAHAKRSPPGGYVQTGYGNRGATLSGNRHSSAVLSSDTLIRDGPAGNFLG
jgi:hypothetical protein